MDIIEKKTRKSKLNEFTPEQIRERKLQQMKNYRSKNKVAISEYHKQYILDHADKYIDDKKNKRIQRSIIKLKNDLSDFSYDQIITLLER